ncbi:competence type IV pilus minor pilin ComGE [Enterococcus sp. LJL128]
MSKKFIKYNGYLFIESFLALTMLTLIIGTYLSVNSLLLEKTKAQETQLEMKRLLYEEVRHYENYGGTASKVIFRNNTYYQLSITLENKKIVKAAIKNGEESFAVEEIE